MLTVAHHHDTMAVGVGAARGRHAAQCHIANFNVGTAVNHNRSPIGGGVVGTLQYHITAVASGGSDLQHAGVAHTVDVTDGGVHQVSARQERQGHRAAHTAKLQGVESFFHGFEVTGVTDSVDTRHQTAAGVVPCSDGIIVGILILQVIAKGVQIHCNVIVARHADIAAQGDGVGLACQQAARPVDGRLGHTAHAPADAGGGDGCQTGVLHHHTRTQGVTDGGAHLRPVKDGYHGDIRRVGSCGVAATSCGCGVTGVAVLVHRHARIGRTFQVHIAAHVQVIGVLEGGQHAGLVNGSLHRSLEG